MKKNGKTLYAGIALLALSTLLLKCKKQEESAQVQTPAAKEETPVNMAKAAITTFVHPGILNTQASLDQVAAEVNGGNNPVRLAAYNKVLDYINQNALPTQFYATVTVGSNGATTASKSQIRKDAILAYALALRWAKTGNITYAQQAIAILNGWSYTFQNYAVLSGSNPQQPSLEASWTTPSFVAAAEILRYYKAFGNASGWSDADINQFKTYITLVKNSYINVTPEYNNNWNASAGYARMSIGIFLDDATAYQNGYNIIQSHLPIIIAPDGTIGEYCDRDDCVHFQYSLTAFAYAAELARIQGDNSLFTQGSNLLSKGYDYMLEAYNGADCNVCSVNSPVFPGTEVAYNYYKSASLKTLRELQDPLGWPNDRTFLGFTSYTHFSVPGL